MLESRPIYIYGLTDPDNLLDIRYVGKTVHLKLKKLEELDEV